MKLINGFSITAVTAFLSLYVNAALGGYDPVIGRFQQQNPVGTGPRVVFTSNGPKFVGLNGPVPPSAQIQNAPHILSTSEIQIVSNITQAVGSSISDVEISQYSDGMNLYEYVSSNPIVYLDPLGTNIYLERGGPGWGLPIAIGLHRNVCVDLWKCCKAGVKPIRVGEACYSFKLIGARWPVLPSLMWLGWSRLNPGGIWEGQIYLSAYTEDENRCTDYEGHVGGTVIETKTTTCEQDIKWYERMNLNRVWKKDTYVGGWLDCRTYSKMEFDDAP